MPVQRRWTMQAPLARRQGWPCAPCRHPNRIIVTMLGKGPWEVECHGQG